MCGLARGLSEKFRIFLLGLLLQLPCWLFLGVGPPCGAEYLVEHLAVGLVFDMVLRLGKMMELVWVLGVDENMVVAMCTLIITVQEFVTAAQVDAAWPLGHPLWFTLRSKRPCSGVVVPHYRVS